MTKVSILGNREFLRSFVGRIGETGEVSAFLAITSNSGNTWLSPALRRRFMKGQVVKLARIELRYDPIESFWMNDFELRGIETPESNGNLMGTHTLLHPRIPQANST
jgi:hypothetical protein